MQVDANAEFFCEMPPGFGSPSFVIKLKKALQGIKQGSFLSRPS